MMGLEDHPMGELALGESEGGAHVVLQHGALGVLLHRGQNLHTKQQE
jgi:hypothetical protein